MNHKRFNLYFISRFWAAIALVAILAGSCNKTLDVQSTHASTDQTQWKSYDDAKSGVFGMYALLKAAYARDNAYWLYGELRDGDFKSVSRTDLSAIISGNLTASYPVLQDLSNWQPFYAAINAASLFIERSKGCLADARYTIQNNKVDIAEAHVVRAFAYYSLARIWGDVPLWTNSNDGDFKALPRSSREKVLQYAEQDILSVINDLPYYYGSNSSSPQNILPGNYFGGTQFQLENSLFGRIQAYIILAHIAADLGNYNDVEAYTAYIQNNIGIISSNLGYSPTSTVAQMTNNDQFNDVFAYRNYRQLVVFNFLYSTGEQGLTNNGHIEYLTIAAPYSSKPLPDMYVPKDTINAIYTDPSDRRFGIDTSTGLHTDAFFGNYSSNIPIFKKINVLSIAGDGGVNKALFYQSAMVFSRYEEVLLLRAEALAVLGKNSDALDILNGLRSNRGLKALSLDQVPDMIDAIFAERRRELIGEGWRWFDIIRYKKIKGNDPVFNALIQDGGIYWPVATEVLGANPKLVQTPHWK